MANLPELPPTDSSTPPPVTSYDAGAFWQFSLVLYPQFQQLLLQWQDQLQAQVNLLLFLAWRDRQPCAPWPALQQALLPTHQQFTLPIRQLRRQANNIQHCASSCCKPSWLLSNSNKRRYASARPPPTVMAALN